MGDIKKIIVACDSTRSLEKAMGLLLGAFFVFNVAYPPDCPLTMELLQRCSCRWMSSAAQLQRRRGNEPAAAPSGPASVPASFAGAYGELAPAEVVEQFVHRQPHRPSVGINGGAGLRSAPPGVRMFQVALHVTEASMEGYAATSRFTEEATCGAALDRATAYISATGCPAHTYPHHL
ncbi:uncharacterized protein LOC144118581 [Amblyomma americanum]